MPGSGSGTGTPIASGPVPVSVTVTPGAGPLLPLDTFRKLLGYNPWHFWGLATAGGGLAPIDSACNDLIAQYSYQNAGIAGREEIREALVAAEQKLSDNLAYYVAPHYKETTLPYPKFLDHQLTRLNAVDPTGRWLGLLLPEGKIIAMGVETLTLIDTTAVTYSDEDGDGLDDTFTISEATTETDETKIAVYLAAADRLDNESVGDKWRVQPVNVSIAGGVVTVTGRAWLLVKPVLYEGYSGVLRAIDPETASNFVSTLEIYVRATNPDGNTVATSQAELIWETVPYPDWATCDDTTDPAALAYAIARAQVRDAEKGLVSAGEAVYTASTGLWSAVTTQWGALARPPERVTLRYLAGESLQSNGQMNDRLARAVAYLAMAELPPRICACDTALRVLYQYQQDLSRLGNTQEQFAVSRRMLNNPFGTKRGHLYAWNEVEQLRLVRGVSA